MTNKLLFSLALMALATRGFAQQSFKYTAKLPKPKSSDFHRIALTPQILARANADLSDIRLMEAKGRIVPYIFGDELPSSGPQQFIAFKRIVTAKTDTTTTFVIENNEHSTAISKLLIKLRSTAVERSADLAGSDDLENWYAIKENITLAKAGEGANAAGVYEQMLSFPSSNYRYFRIRVNNKRRDPVAILQAGIYGMQRTEKPAYQPLPGTLVTQKDSGRLSHVLIKLGDDYPVNQLSLDIVGAKYYKRKIRLYAVDGRKRQLLMERSISSAADNLFRFSTKTPALEVEIDNGDNPPITVMKAETSMLQQSLIAYLDMDEGYRLIFGDSTATTPGYDLKFFADSLKHEMPVLLPGSVYRNGPYNKPSAKAVSRPAWAIWVIIAAVLAVLMALTFAMTRELKKRNL